MTAGRYVLALLRAEPALATGFVALLDFMLILSGAPKPLVVVLTGFLTPLLIAVRKVVWPADKVAKAVTDASMEAATATAETLTDETVGVAGALTAAGRTIVSTVGGGAAHAALKAIGVPRNVRAKAVSGK